MESMEAPTPSMDYDKNSKEISFYIKSNIDTYYIKIKTMKEYLVITALNESNIKNNYSSYFTFDYLKNISKSMRYFDNLEDIISFIEDKSKKNEIILKKENDEKLNIEFKIISPNGKEDNILLELKPQKISDKEMISILVKKVEYLEKEVEILKDKINKSEDIISKNKKDILSLFEEINILKNNNLNKNEIKKETQIDSKIVNINDIDFIIKRLKESPIIDNKNFQFNLLYRGTRDGDDTIKLHQICDKKKNIIIFMRSEQGNNYGGFSNVGWESRKVREYEYPIDDNAFLFSVNKKKIFNAKKGKNSICWINSDKYGLCFNGSLVFYNKFLTKENTNFYNTLSSHFENCSLNDFNSGIESCKFQELEVFEIK